MKRVLMIVQNDFVNDSRIIKEANTLGKKGYTVKVLALHNDGLMEEENFDFFTVNRLKLDTRNSLGKDKFSQIFKYLEFQKKCVKKAEEFKPDIVHCHDVYTLPIGNKIHKKLRNIKLVYDSHELWSHASNNASMPKILINFQNNLEKRIIKKCSAVISVSKSITKYLKDTYNLVNEPFLIRNMPKQKLNLVKKDLFRSEFNIPKDKKIVLYQGAVGKGRGIEELLNSMTLLDDNIVMVVLGNGNMVKVYKEMAEKLKINEKVFFHKAVSPEILIEYTSSADLGISMIKNTCLSYYYSLPNKMFEYIQAEIPVICSNYPDMEHIVTEYGVGESADPEDYSSISNKIIEVLSNSEKYSKYKENCVNAKKVLNWETEEKKLISLYENL